MSNIVIYKGFILQSFKSGNTFEVEIRRSDAGTMIVDKAPVKRCRTNAFKYVDDAMREAKLIADSVTMRR